jgi:hypothetical protein
MRQIRAMAGLAVLAAGLALAASDPAAAADPYARTGRDELYAGTPTPRGVRKPENYGQAWHRPHRWPEHRPTGVYVGVPTYPYWRVPAVDFGPEDAAEPACFWKRVYGPYQNKTGERLVGWHKVPICD